MIMTAPPPLPTIFYFASVRELRNFHSFDVEARFPVIDGKSCRTFDVVATETATGQRHILAEFPAEGPADTFRDMAEICSRA